MALFSKPKDVRYTDMCIWIDANAYKEDCDEDKLFEYLYHIMMMLAYKRAFFNKSYYYEDFAIYGATRLFMRYKNPKQFNDDTKVTKIKSVLNYAKIILYSTKVAFESENYAQNYTKLSDDFTAVDTEFHSKILSTIDETKLIEFSSYLEDITKTIKGFVSKLPKQSEKEFINIYLSCILSLLNSITLNNSAKEKFNALKAANKLKVEHIDKFYKNERENCVILYHLDNNMKGYIQVLVNEIRHILSSNLSFILHENINSDANIKSLLLQTINGDISQQEGFDEY